MFVPAAVSDSEVEYFVITLLTGFSPRSGRQNKAWGGARMRETPGKMWDYASAREGGR